MSEECFIQRNEPLLHVRRRKIVLFTGLQIVGIAACVAISQTIAAIGTSSYGLSIKALCFLLNCDCNADVMWGRRFSDFHHLTHPFALDLHATMVLTQGAPSDGRPNWQQQDGTS